MTDRWWTRAACIGTPMEVFFPESSCHVDDALALCAGCPVRGECLAEALAAPRHDDYGIRGGTRREERLRMRDRRRLAGTAGWWTVEDLAAHLGCSRDQVKLEVESLVEAGWITCRFDLFAGINITEAA